MIRRITTGFVSIARARTSEVMGPSRSAMCRRTCRTPDNWLLRFMQPNMLHDVIDVKAPHELVRRLPVRCRVVSSALAPRVQSIGKQSDRRAVYLSL